ncbi:MAG: tRNA lysidine(34) synthetase TilS [Deltaproteobacteria bacterium]|nr:tRNA lysidine(34) synthetase TilS [Deltaproteobacteria bacterium]
MRRYRTLSLPLFDIDAAPDLPRWVGILTRREEFFASGDRVLAAVSGGPDSMALLHLLTRLGREMGFTVGVAHFNHLLRGRDSDEDAAFVGRAAQELGLPFHLGAGDVRQAARRKKVSLQMAARDLRLAFLKETCRLEGYNKLALGHTADDQVEQFFLRLLRGAGIQGLKGMEFATPAGIVRPLLAAGKEVILAWLRQEGLSYREDASNLSRRYLRNRVRLELLPELARSYNPRIKVAVWRLMSLLDEDERLLASQTLAAWEQVGRRLTPDFSSIRVAELLDLPLGLQKRVLRHALENFAGGGEITSARVDNLLALARAAKSGGQIKFKECQAARAGQELHLWRRLPPPGKTATLVSVPGTWETPDGWRITLSPVTLPDDPVQAAAFGEVFLDAAPVNFPLTVRHFRPGDRFWPQGGPGTRKLQDFLVDRKIPRWLRPHLPLVESRGRIILVAGLAIAEPVKITPHTANALLLQIVPASEYTVRVWGMLRAWLSQADSAPADDNDSSDIGTVRLPISSRS